MEVQTALESRVQDSGGLLRLRLEGRATGRVLGSSYSPRKACGSWKLEPRDTALFGNGALQRESGQGEAVRAVITQNEAPQVALR